MLAQEEARRLGHNFVGTEQVREESIERANGRGFGARGDEEGGVGGETRGRDVRFKRERRGARGERAAVSRTLGMRGRRARTRGRGRGCARARARRRDTDGD